MNEKDLKDVSKLVSDGPAARQLKLEKPIELSDEDGNPAFLTVAKAFDEAKVQFAEAGFDNVILIGFKVEPSTDHIRWARKLAGKKASTSSRLVGLLEMLKHDLLEGD